MQPLALTSGLFLVFLVLLLRELFAILLERFVRYYGASSVERAETEGVEIDPHPFAHPALGV